MQLEPLDSGRRHGLVAVLYTVLAFLAFCSDSYLLPTGVKYAVNLLVFLWAGTMCLFKPQPKRAVFCARFWALFFFPYLVFWMWSAVVWTGRLASVAYVVRGTKNIVYMLTNLLMTCSAVYLVGQDAMVCSLIAMGTTHFLVLVGVVRSYGPGETLREFGRLLASFSVDTGPAMRTLEVHGLAFGWGVFVLYFLIASGERPARRVAGLLVSGLFFLLDFKRILVPAVLGGALVYRLTRRLPPATVRRLSVWAAAGTGAAAFGYLLSIRSGVLFKLTDRLGIHLMFRDVLYRSYDDFYTFSPLFPGQGIRFLYAYAALHPEAYEAAHNVYLEFYIELGFWCWWFWLFYALAVRVRRISAWGFAQGAAAAAAMNACVFCTYLTDNTSFYYCINVLSRMAVMEVCLAQAAPPQRSVFTRQAGGTP